jgi:long-chain acyl-CoA synthetase
MPTLVLPQTPATRAAWFWLESRNAADTLQPETRLQEDLGIDSIDWMELASVVRETSGVEIRDDAMAGMDTVGDLLQHLVGARRVTQAEPWPSPIECPEAELGEDGRFWLSPLGPLERWGGRCLYALNRVLIRMFVRLDVVGRQHIPRNEQVVFVPQHTSYLDGPALGAVLDSELLSRTSWAVFTGSCSVL